MAKPTTIQIAAFMKRHLAAVKSTPREILLSLVEWYTRVAIVGVMRMDGRIVSVALARCVKSVDQAEADPWANDEDGQIIWVQHIVSQHPAGLGVLLTQALQRYGRRAAFAGRVFLRDGELRMLPWTVVERLCLEENPHHHELVTRSLART
jgi:hypothetical protein